MENKLEQLLNSLIEKGWKPFGMKSTFDYVDILCNQPYRFKHLNSRFGASLRELVSKESGLWQFVCENKMIPYDEDGYTWYERTKDYIDDFENTGEMLDLQIDNSYEYRLIESSLKDESELEDFLLNSISLHE